MSVIELFGAQATFFERYGAGLTSELNILIDSVSCNLRSLIRSHEAACLDL